MKWFKFVSIGLGCIGLLLFLKIYLSFSDKLILSEGPISEIICSDNQVKLIRRAKINSKINLYHNQGYFTIEGDIQPYYVIDSKGISSSSGNLMIDFKKEGLKFSPHSQLNTIFQDISLASDKNSKNHLFYKSN